MIKYIDNQEVIMIKAGHWGGTYADINTDIYGSAE